MWMGLVAVQMSLPCTAQHVARGVTSVVNRGIADTAMIASGNRHDVDDPLADMSGSEFLQCLFRAAHFPAVIRAVVGRSGWSPELEGDNAARHSVRQYRWRVWRDYKFYAAADRDAAGPMSLTLGGWNG